MTLGEFREMLANRLPEDIDLVHCRGLNAVVPRAVWQEGRIEQTYASDGACSEHTVVVLEYITRDEEDTNVRRIKDMFRAENMPFVCQVEFDEDEDMIYYTFNLWLEDDVP